MKRERSRRVSRRALVVAVVGGAAGLSRLGGAPAALALPSRGVGGGGGITGGGHVDLGGDEAQFSVHASRRQIDEAGTLVFAGDLRWEDRAAGLSLRSTAVAFYGPPAADPTAREVRGELVVNGGDRHPFVFRVELDELAPLSDDVVHLSVAAIGYFASGPLMRGSVTVLRFGPPDA